MLAWNKEKFKGQSKKTEKLEGFIIEVKINKEIQRYQESILFCLSLRQMVFALLAIGVAVGAYFGLKAAHRRGGGRLGVHAGGVPVCHVRLFYL